MPQGQVDLANVSEQMAQRLEEVKLSHTAMQACSKAWDGIEGPSDGKRTMFDAFKMARQSFVHACAREKQAFDSLDAVVGQGDLFAPAPPPSVATTASLDATRPSRAGKASGVAVVARGKKAAEKSGTSADDPAVN